MSHNIKSQSFSFYISLPTEVSVVPEAHTLSNEFDYIGGIVSLKRLPEEKNASYKQRILDVNVHIGDPTYDGTISNLTRELGLDRENCIEIDLKLNSSGEPLAQNPRVDILANRVVLYSDWRPNETEIIDKEIRTYLPTDNGYFLSDLVSEINSSTCFSASIYSGIRPNLHSSNLVRNSSHNIIRGDIVEASNKFILSAENIVQDSLYFQEEEIFQTEVFSTPSSNGEFSLNYRTGEVEVYSTPSGTFNISYHYNIFPLVIDYSSIQLYSLQDSSFVDELFYKETLASEEEINSLPTAEGSEIYHQLNMETKYFWGK